MQTINPKIEHITLIIIIFFIFIKYIRIQKYKNTYYFTIDCFNNFNAGTSMIAAIIRLMIGSIT